MFSDIRITNTNSASQYNVKTEKVLLRHEKEKKREYNRWIMNIVHGTLAKKLNESYEKVITVIRCKLSFIIVRSALLCIRGSRSNHVLKDIDGFSLAFDSSGL